MQNPETKCKPTHLMVPDLNFAFPQTQFQTRLFELFSIQNQIRRKNLCRTRKWAMQHCKHLTVPHNSDHLSLIPSVNSRKDLGRISRVR